MNKLINDINVEDLLNREKILFNNDDEINLIKDKVVLITGGGGSIGSELARQIIKLNPKGLIIFDIYENNAYDIEMELKRVKYKNNYIKTEINIVIGSVYNYKRVEYIFKKYKPELIYHAAAYKHVPLMESNVVEAVRTNIIGTYNVAELSNNYNVDKMILISTDKAINPKSIMGATKKYAENIISYFNNFNKTIYSAVRFGNILDSNGSVIPLFKKQIKDGGPITLTHKDMVRYFMTKEEAVGLVLKSSVYALGNEIFMLDMGNQIKIYDLAIKMIELYGLKFKEDIDVEITGVRKGEKIAEELLDFSKYLNTNHNKIYFKRTNQINNINIGDFKNIDSYNGKELINIIKKCVKF